INTKEPLKFMKTFPIYLLLFSIILAPFVVKARILDSPLESQICQDNSYSIKWSDCVNNKQYSSLVKVKECVGEYTPPTQRDCIELKKISPCEESSFNYGEWTPCINKVSIRTATMKYDCNGTPPFPVIKKTCDILPTEVAATTSKLLNKEPKVDLTFAKKQVGKILLQVESRGEAWYVSQTDSNRYYMADGNAAYNIMRNLGVGISNANLEKIEKNKALALKQKGKIFLQVESHGEAYYVDFSGNLHYLKNGLEAYNIMRTIGIGITTRNLEQIPSKTFALNIVNNNPEVIIDKNHVEPFTSSATTTQSSATPAALKNGSDYINFKSMFTVNKISTTVNDEILYNAKYNGALNQDEFWTYFSSINADLKIVLAKQLATEVRNNDIKYTAALYFKYSTVELGYAFAYPPNEYYLNGYAVASFTQNPFNAQ
ncbi:MAG: hypothetical protein NT094_00695, partial [Candidatus Staskawiczbacteria bacterium]|nr:hypothetical protein [Candidatus Staskawiczbacteria bacterium]